MGIFSPPNFENPYDGKINQKELEERRNEYLDEAIDKVIFNVTLPKEVIEDMSLLRERVQDELKKKHKVDDFSQLEKEYPAQMIENRIRRGIFEKFNEINK